MNLISLQFAVFLLAALLVYYVLPLKMRWWALLASGVAFFLLSSSSPFTVFYLVFSILSVYLAARYIEKESSQHRRYVYVLTLVCNVTILATLKYLDGLWESGSDILSAFGVSVTVPEFGWVAPLGISFYTLQLISYLTDTYWGVIPAQKNLAKLGLFASWFPSISSGPILRYNQVDGMLFGGNRLSYQNITFGLQRVMWGLFKKMVIAERMALITGPIFADVEAYSGAWLWFGLFAAVIHIYTDFSGNMDIILGVSECFGVRLPENFRQPFFSLTIQEFWQRWHITLGSWLKDYIMYPLLRSRLWARLGKVVKKRHGKRAAKLIPPVLAMLALWLAMGVWHGGNLHFFMMVLWFWFAITMGQLLEPVFVRVIRRLRIKTDCFGWRLFQRVRTFACYSVGALFFFIPNVSDAFMVIRQAFTADSAFDLEELRAFFPSTGVGIADEATEIFVILFSLGLMFFVEAWQNRGVASRQWLGGRSIVFRWVVLLGLIFAVLLLGVYGPGYDASEFMYAGF